MSRNVSKLLEENMPERVMAIAKGLGKAAEEIGLQAYLVGGPVRDLILNNTPADVDFAVEGDVSSLANYLVEVWNAEIVMRSQFLTVKLSVDGTIIDLASARQERYLSPGNLPEVKAASIRKDLARRDFSINSMAIAMAPKRFGKLLDPFDGESDLKSRKIRILHQDSFRDDPTRILRSLRYEQRLNFHLEDETESLIKDYSPLLSIISPDRIRHELERVLNEPTPDRVLARADELGVLSDIHPCLHWTPLQSTGASRLANENGFDPLTCLALMAYSIGQEDAEAIANRLNMPKAWASIWLEMPQLQSVLSSLNDKSFLPSQVEEDLRHFSERSLLAAKAMGLSYLPSKWLSCYMDCLRYIRPMLTGDDILDMGIPPGPLVGEVLASLHKAKLDGRLISRQDEVNMVQHSAGQSH